MTEPRNDSAITPLTKGKVGGKDLWIIDEPNLCSFLTYIGLLLDLYKEDSMSSSSSLQESFASISNKERALLVSSRVVITKASFLADRGYARAQLSTKKVLNILSSNNISRNEYYNKDKNFEETSISDPQLQDLINQAELIIISPQELRNAIRTTDY